MSTQEYSYLKYKLSHRLLDSYAQEKYFHLQYLPVYNAHFFPAEKAPKMEMRIRMGTVFTLV